MLLLIVLFTQFAPDRGNDNWLIRCVRPDKEPEVSEQRNDLCHNLFIHEYITFVFPQIPICCDVRFTKGQRIPQRRQCAISRLKYGRILINYQFESRNGLISMKCRGTVLRLLH